MAQIVINEVSQNYTYNIGANSFATVALPITASWGPGYFEPDSYGKTREEFLETTVWQRFPATQAGLEAFVSTYRGPASNYRIAKDYSYQMAMTLLTAGYDILVCRLCPGVAAEGRLTTKDNATLSLKAKYPGTFGNNLRVILKKVPNREYWNLITYVVDPTTAVRTAVENLTFTFDLDNPNDAILNINEVESAFITWTIDGTLTDKSEFNEVDLVALSGGTDKVAVSEGETAADIIAKAVTLATERYRDSGVSSPDKCEYVTTISGLTSADLTKATTLLYKEWLYTNVVHVYDLLKDRLSYSPQRIISPGWDDQNYTEITDSAYTQNFTIISPIHKKLMEVGYYSRCGAALLDVPKSLGRSFVYNDTTDAATEGYAQKLSRVVAESTVLDVNQALYTTHSALFAPWSTYKYVGTNKQNPAPPAFIALMIQRAMILNQSTQYEWALPTNRKHKLRIGKLDYTVGQKHLDVWQKLEGVGVNVITVIPELGTTLWGNSTLYEVPAATYQALANLSTRYLVNAVEDLAYRCGIQITFQYNNDQAYSAFHAGMTPLLDTMKNVGAIDGYYIKMSADIDGRDHVNANTVIAKVYLVINGVINDIVVDLIALPPGTDLAQFEA